MAEWFAASVVVFRLKLFGFFDVLVLGVRAHSSLSRYSYVSGLPVNGPLRLQVCVNLCHEQ